ncbi:hypothetical protein BY996DRAFT_6499593 [Phakopsora pachyrhizi]|nr:hypothetical protein BY996DRAFT_6499593 [Phakopsora pachyrhizi]
MSQYSGYGNPFYGGYYDPYDNQTPYYGYGQPDYVTGLVEGSGSSIHNIEDFQPLMDTQDYILIVGIAALHHFDLKIRRSTHTTLWSTGTVNTLSF